MKQAFLLFSHQLTTVQQDELKNDFKIDRIIYLPSALQVIWSDIPPEISSIKIYLKDIFFWLKKNSNYRDLVLVQGDFGATFITVDFCLKTGLIPIYATTKRVVKENNTVLLKKEFVHFRFREYEKWSQEC